MIVTLQFSSLQTPPVLLPAFDLRPGPDAVPRPLRGPPLPLPPQEVVPRSDHLHRLAPAGGGGRVLPPLRGGGLAGGGGSEGGAGEGGGLQEGGGGEEGQGVIQGHRLRRIPHLSKGGGSVTHAVTLLSS